MFASARQTAARASNTLNGGMLGCVSSKRGSSSMASSLRVYGIEDNRIVTLADHLEVRPSNVPGCWLLPVSYNCN